MFIILFLLCARVQSNPVNTSAPQILMANLVWRHGDRSPFATYPTNPHTEDFWINGYGGLTKLGMIQQFQLGQMLRSMYINSTNPLLSKFYNPKEVYITSTDFNRTIVSALSNLAGMFDNGRAGEDHPDIMNWPQGWTPIPVHVIPRNDPMNPVAECARAKEIMDEMKNSSSYLKLTAENRDFLDFMSNKTGMTIGMYEMYFMNDIHFIQGLYNLSQPDWFTEDVRTRVKKLAHISEHFLSGVADKPYIEYIKLRGGRLLKSIIDRMNFKIDCFSREKDCNWISNLKYFAFSAHDSTLMALIATLGDPEKILAGRIPSYTASISFELWNVPGTGPSVRVLYHNSVNDKFNIVTHLIDGCPQNEFCDLKTFRDRSSKYLPMDLEAECRATK